MYLDVEITSLPLYGNTFSQPPGFIIWNIRKISMESDFFFVKVKSLEISLQGYHITYKRRCEILHDIDSRDSSVGRAIGSDPQC